KYNPQNEKLVKASMEAVQTALLQSKNGSLPIWVKPKEPQELSSGQRSSDTMTSQPFSPYSTESRKNATVVKVDQTIPVPELVSALESKMHLHHYPADELLSAENQPIRLGDNENGLVVTGYRMNTQDRKAEHKLQGFVRAAAQSGRSIT